jgi:hypothetical protein
MMSSKQRASSVWNGILEATFADFQRDGWNEE